MSLQFGLRRSGMALGIVLSVNLGLPLASGWGQTATLEADDAAVATQQADAKQEADQRADQDDNAGRAQDLPAGINDSFLDPDMKVEDFIQRFEIESREVFACRHQILAAVGLKPGMAVADVGSGTGLYVAPFAAAVGLEGKVYAIDISPNFIKHLRSRVKNEQMENVEVVLCSDHSINLPPNSVDRIFVCDVYHHFEFPASSLASIRSALRDGGELILIDFARDGEGERGEWLRNHVRAPQEVFQQEIVDAGFKFKEEVAIDGFKENYFLRFTK